MPNTALNVKLLKYTESPLETIALAGRLCYAACDIESLADESKGTAEKFVRKLMELGHLSPIEHVSYTFGVEGVSRTLLAQITRHRIASFSVQSQRYVRSDDFGYIVPPSIKESPEFLAVYEEQMKIICGWYNSWIERGLNPEDARFVLPGSAETRIIVTMNARELLHFFSLRCCNRAQWEIRALAWVMLGMVRRTTPVLFDNCGASCTFGACSEGKMSCGELEKMKKLNDELNELVKNGASDSELLDFACANV